MQESIIFSAYETSLYIDELEEVKVNFNIEGNSDSDLIEFTIDNLLNGKIYPLIEITTPSSASIYKLSDGVNSITSTQIIGQSDLLSLDFKKQEYLLSNNNVMGNFTFNGMDRIHLTENKINTFSIACIGTVNVRLIYKKYKEKSKLNFVDSLKIQEKKSYRENKKFDNVEVSSKSLSKVTYSVDISKKVTDWDLKDKLNNNEELRIRYNEEHSSEPNEFNKALIGFKSDSYTRKFNESDGFLEERFSGNAISLY